MNVIDLNSPVFASKLSVVVCFVLSAIGITLGLMEESLAVLTNGLIAAIDIINSFFFFSAVKHSIKMPDVFHSYGYGKYESLAILSSALLLILISSFTIYQFSEFSAISHDINFSILLIFSTFSFFAMQGMYRIQKRAVTKNKMPVLEYDSDIWRFDSYIELGVIANLIIGLVLHRYNLHTYASILDSVTAVVLIGMATKIPIQHGKNALDQLLDRTLPETIQYDILSVIVENIDKMCEYNGVHTRQAGKDIFIEIDAVMPFDITLNEAFQTEKIILNSLKEKYPNAIPRLYITPCSKDCVHSGKNHCPVKKSLNSALNQ